MFSVMMSSLLVALLCVVTVHPFLIPNYAGNNYNIPTMSGFGQNSFNGIAFPTMPPMTAYYPAYRPGYSIITNNVSAQGPTSAGSGATGGGSVSGTGVSVGGSASSSGSYNPGQGATSNSNSASWSNGKKSATFPQASYGSFQPTLYGNGQYPATYNYNGVASGLGFPQYQAQPMAFAWAPVAV